MGDENRKPDCDRNLSHPLLASPFKGEESNYASSFKGEESFYWAWSLITKTRS
jgi:hypothetical protein